MPESGWIVTASFSQVAVQAALDVKVVVKLPPWGPTSTMEGPMLVVALKSSLLQDEKLKIAMTKAIMTIIRFISHIY